MKEDREQGNMGLRISFSSEESKELPKPQKVVNINSFGDDFTYLAYDAADNSDDEVEEFAKLKVPQEIKDNIRLSKRGIIEFCDRFIETESPHNKSKPAIAKAWESKIKSTGLQVFIKKGGSPLSDSQPFVRIEATFPRAVKMHNLIDAVSSPETNDL